MPNLSSTGQKIRELEFWPGTIPKIAWWCHTYLLVITSAKFLWLLRDFVPEYHHAKFCCNWTTNKGETEGAQCAPQPIWFQKIPAWIGLSIHISAKWQPINQNLSWLIGTPNIFHFWRFVFCLFGVTPIDKFSKQRNSSCWAISITVYLTRFTWFSYGFELQWLSNLFTKVMRLSSISQLRFAFLNFHSVCQNISLCLRPCLHEEKLDRSHTTKW